ncbi:prepilin peptidase [Thaumasiovibrio subtropicus]|uniref:prepilin peptidase n=1 Tax=Thaumasiovibrio subtropicus TaxID=1891207 RepID=UPI000B35E130|nr:prepilin peptidase [Thaumasiovibrio subtropicus]
MLEATLLFLLALCAMTDLISRKIPNAAVGTLFVLALYYRCQLAEPQWLLVTTVFFALFFLGYACWQSGWVGGGDVKLLATAGLLVGSNWQHYLLYTALASGVVAIAVLWMARFRCTAVKPTLPLGVAIAASASFFII